MSCDENLRATSLPQGWGCFHWGWCRGLPVVLILSIVLWLDGTPRLIPSCEHQRDSDWKTSSWRCDTLPVFEWCDVQLPCLIFLLHKSWAIWILSWKREICLVLPHFQFYLSSLASLQALDNPEPGRAIRPEIVACVHIFVSVFWHLWRFKQHLMWFRLEGHSSRMR